jgi:ATP-binding cassette subfamily B protein
MVSAERALALLDERPDVVERPHARALPRATGAVELREVSFAYEASRPVLRGVTCSIAAGTRVGIAGPTGAGKTTLISLLARFYDPTDGAILLDGADLRDLRLDDLRRQFSFVLQEPVLFSTTIAENIAYGRPGATERDIVAAATAAHAHEFISRWASAAACSPAASGSASRSPARSSKTRRSSCWMSPPAPSTSGPRRSSSGPWTR